MRVHHVSAGLASLSFLALSSLACAPLPPPSPGQAGAPSSAVHPASAPAASPAPNPWAEKGVARLISDAARLRPLVKSEAVARFLARARALPRIASRTLYADADKSHYYTEAERASLPPAVQATLVPRVVDEEEYYNTHYGSPLSYSRPLDLLFQRGVTLPPGSKYLDFGFGYIGQLRLLATMGVEATGVDVWPFLRALYSFPGDQGEIAGPEGERGSVRLLDGRFPADPAIVRAVGSGYALIVAKNVLKRGYLHPERPVDDPKKLISLGVPDAVAIKAFYDALAPGGHFLIYNICPAEAPPDKPFIPWSDGRSPFPREGLEAAGFEVLDFDRDDKPAVQQMARALGWDQPEDGEPGMDVENDLAVLYTLVRRPAGR